MLELAGLTRPLCVPRGPSIGSGLCCSLDDRQVLGGFVGPMTVGLFRSYLAECSGHLIGVLIVGKTPGPTGFYILVTFLLLLSEQLP